MRFEVEQKFRVSDSSALRSALAARGAVAGPPVEQEDRYLAHPARDFAATNEALRLRRSGASQVITYKGPRRGGPTKTREELEVSFAPDAESFETLGQVFERLGFRPVRTVRKTRQEFAIRPAGRSMTVALDEVEGLGSFVEVETLAAGEADLPEAQQAVMDLAAELGLREMEPRSYLRMHLQTSLQGDLEGPS